MFPECPIRNILSRIGEKWTLLVLLNLAQHEPDGLRFNELGKLIPDVSQRMLTATLRSLEAEDAHRGRVRRAARDDPRRVLRVPTEARSR